MVSDPYTELLESWDDVRVKPSEITSAMHNDFITLAHEVTRWLERGENDRFRAKLDELRSHIPKTDLPRRALYEIAVAFMVEAPFTVDDEEYPDEPNVFRIWRTVERGYPIMDARLKADPTYHAYPRVEFFHGEDEEGPWVSSRIVSMPPSE